MIQSLLRNFNSPCGIQDGPPPLLVFMLLMAASVSAGKIGESVIGMDIVLSVWDNDGTSDDGGFKGFRSAF